MNMTWSQITPLEEAPPASSYLDIGTALSVAADSISRLVRGNAVHIVSYDLVYGASTGDDEEISLVPAYEFICETGEHFVVNAITGELIF